MDRTRDEWGMCGWTDEQMDRRWGLNGWVGNEEEEEKNRQSGRQAIPPPLQSKTYVENGDDRWVIATDNCWDILSFGHFGGNELEREKNRKNGTNRRPKREL